jgi:hypothetical protein
MSGLAVVGDDNVYSGRWSNGVVPFVILDGMTEGERKAVIDAMNYISQNTNACFKPKTNEKYYVKFRKLSVQELGWSGGQSWLGRCSICPDGQEIKLSKFAHGTIRHEISHALGLNHEQTREDRDQFIEILWNNVEPGREGNFTQLNLIQTDVGAYDYRSLMHYKRTAFGKIVNGSRLQTMRRRDDPSNTSFGSRGELNPGDIVAINRMYPVNTTCPKLTTLLPGELEVGQSVTRDIHAREAYNYTGVYMRQGQKFEFTTASREWNNGGRETTAEGYPGGPLDALRRHPEYHVMALVGEVFSQNGNPLSYTGKYFKIGNDRTWTATQSGFLVTFANDCLACYGDNSRLVRLTIKRTE